MNHFKVEVIADSSGNWVGNGLTFGDRKSAEAYAIDLHSRWTAVTQWRVVDVAGPRPIAAIAAEIRKDWKKVYFGAVPYLAAMASLDQISDDYGADSAQSIVLYFLSNESTWRGDTAKRVKSELKAIAGIK